MWDGFSGDNLWWKGVSASSFLEGGAEIFLIHTITHEKL